MNGHKITDTRTLERWAELDGLLYYGFQDLGHLREHVRHEFVIRLSESDVYLFIRVTSTTPGDEWSFTIHADQVSRMMFVAALNRDDKDCLREACRYYSTSFPD